MRLIPSNDGAMQFLGKPILSVGIMLFSAEPISRFVNEHPTVKVLALSFLLLIGALPFWETVRCRPG